MTRKIFYELRRQFPFAEIEPGKNGHYRLLLPNGAFYTGGTPSDQRSIRNLRAMVKRALNETTPPTRTVSGA